MFTFNWGATFEVIEKQYFSTTRMKMKIHAYVHILCKDRHQIYFICIVISQKMRSLISKIEFDL